LEKWFRQIKSGEITPEFLGLGDNKEKALEKLKRQINDLQKHSANLNKNHFK